MKNLHVVMSNGYKSIPVAAFENRGDAVRLACSIHDCSASDLSGSEIKTVPYVGETKVVDPQDLGTVVDIIIQAYDAAIRTERLYGGIEEVDDATA